MAAVLMFLFEELMLVDLVQDTKSLRVTVSLLKLPFSDLFSKAAFTKAVLRSMH